MSVEERLPRLSALSSTADAGVVTELFSPPRVAHRVRMSRPQILRAGSSFDPHADPAPREVRDFLGADQHQARWRRPREEDPWIVVGSPPCTALSAIKGLSKRRAAPPDREHRLVEGRTWYIVLRRVSTDGRFGEAGTSCANIRRQAQPQVQQLERREGVHTRVGDVCVFLMRSVEDDGVDKPCPTHRQ